MQVPRVWVLLGERRGDNNQLLALAEAIGLPFEAKRLRYRWLRLLDKRLLGATLAVLTPQSRGLVSGDPPDLLLAIGHRSVPVVRALKRRSRGRMLAVQLGNPRVPPSHFDLLVTTPQYPVAGAPNVLRNPIALGAPATPAAPLPDSLSHPLSLLLVGGPTIFWTLDEGDVVQALRTLAEEARTDAGSVALLTSQRTPKALVRRLKALAPSLAAPVHIGASDSYAELLAAADQLFVTADSVSMISEAIATGKPVGMVPVRQTPLGRFWLGLCDRMGTAAFPRDLRRFWSEVRRRGLAGTVEQPVRGEAPDTLAQTAERVRALLAARC